MLWFKRVNNLINIPLDETEVKQLLRRYPHLNAKVTEYEGTWYTVLTVPSEIRKGREEGYVKLSKGYAYGDELDE